MKQKLIFARGSTEVWCFPNRRVTDRRSMYMLLVSGRPVLTIAGDENLVELLQFIKAVYRDRAASEYGFTNTGTGQRVKHEFAFGLHNLGDQSADGELSRGLDDAGDEASEGIQ